MSKAVLISIQPYYVFLIIAKAMGWDIPQEKTIEVRKTIPKDKNWDRKTIIYCCKNKNSFAKIPKEYQPLMERFLGKVIGEFVCDTIITDRTFGHDPMFKALSCMSDAEIASYCTANEMYGFHISDLVIYDKPKELSEFYALCYSGCNDCKYQSWDYSCGGGKDLICTVRNKKPITRPPQSWGYVEELP